MNILKRLLFFLPVIAGVLVMVNMISNKKEPSRPEIAELSRTVSVVNVHPMSITPKIRGYGYVQPTDVWEALPEVSGKVIEIHPELKKGSFIPKGALLVRINPETYGLAESRSVASVMSIESRLKELAQQKRNTITLLKTEEQKLKLKEQELARKQKLYDKGVISISELEQEERTLLVQQGAVDQLKNNLELIPAQENTLLAQKQSDVSNLTERRLDLEKTIIRAPFDCRIAEVNIELDQFAPAGVMVLRAINISKVEIPVQLSPNAFSNLISPAVSEKSPIEATGLDMNAIRELIGISATVRVPLFNREAKWQGTFMRTSDSIDLDTGAITAFIEVDQPYLKIIPSQRPPLVPNLYAEVELQGSPRDSRFVIPFHAIHNGYIHLVDEQNRLKRQEIEVEMVLGDLAVLKDDLGQNVQVITTDLVPAINGMLLVPMIDEELSRRITSLDVSR